MECGNYIGHSWQTGDGQKVGRGTSSKKIKIINILGRHRLEIVGDLDDKIQVSLELSGCAQLGLAWIGTIT